MDPLTMTVVMVLGRYAIDKGAALAEKAGPKALEVAGELFTKVLDRIRKKKLTIAEEYEQDPETYAKPVEKELDAELAADAEFKAEIGKLLAKFQEAEKEHTGSPGGTSYSATLTGSGAIAQGTGNVALGAGSTNISGGFAGDLDDLERLRRLNERKTPDADS